MRGDTLYKLIKFLLNGAVQEISMCDQPCWSETC